MSFLSEEMETEPILYPSGTTTPLLGICSGYERLDQPRELAPLVKSIYSSDADIVERWHSRPHLLVFPGIDDAGDIGYCDSCFCDVGGQNYLSCSFWRDKEGMLLLLIWQ